MKRVSLGIICAFFLSAGWASKPADVTEIFGERLLALTPAEPLAYYELAEEIVDTTPSDPDAIRLARWLYGTAGRLDMDALGSSAALAIAQMTADKKERRRLRAAAMMLDPLHGEMRVSADSTVVDAETAFAISEAFGGFRTGRGQRLRRMLSDPSRRELLNRYDDLLPGGVVWLDEASKRPRGRPVLDRNDLVQMLRVEVRLLEGETPSWSSEALGGGATPLLEIKREEIDDLLGGNPEKPYWRDGAWVGIRQLR